MVTLITRSDDAGSSHSANLAVCKVMRAGIVRNVSLMAPCAFIEEFAAMCKDAKNAKAAQRITFGMHATLNAEWDRVKWKPLSSVSERLTDRNGYFLPDPKQFLETKPSVPEIIGEYEAQLRKLRSLGFDVQYVDSHMLPELFVPGLFDATDDFAKRHGLINHIRYYDLPGEDFLKHPKRYDGRQLFVAAHPSLDTEEMRQTGNADVSGPDVARNRAKETKLYASLKTKWFLKWNHIVPISYLEAVPGTDETARSRVKYGGEP